MRTDKDGGTSLVDLEPAYWPQVRRIYEDGLATGHASFETTAPAWDAWDAAHLKTPRIAAIENDQVIGWAALSPISRSPVIE